MNITRRTEKVKLYDGADLARLDELREAIDNAVVRREDAGPRTLDDTGDDVAAAAAAFVEFEAEASERAIVVTLSAVGRRVYRDIVAKHPPREDDKLDQAVGFNNATLGDDLVPASIVDPEFPNNAARDEFLDALSHADFTRLYSVAYNLNATVGPDPKAEASSILGLTSGEI